METTAALSPPEATPADPCDDRELLARFRAGESAAFEAIVAAHQRRIVRLVHRLLGGLDGVDDVTQEVFLAVLENLGRFRGKCTLSTWLTTIAVNKCRSRLRRHRLRLRLLPWLAKPDAAQPDAGRHVEAAESHQRVREAVEQLPAKYREPVVLRYYEQMSARRIGEVLGISTGAVEVRLSRARRRLRETLSVSLGE